MWLAVVTGARRGEMCALRWSHLDLESGFMWVRRNYVAGREKDPKNHQARRLSIDAATVELIRKHRAECERPLASVGGKLDAASFVFSAVPDRSRQRSPSSMTHRFKRLADRLGIEAHLHALGHYAAGAAYSRRGSANGLRSPPRLASMMARAWATRSCVMAGTPSRLTIRNLNWVTDGAEQTGARRGTTLSRTWAIEPDQGHDQDVKPVSPGRPRR